MKLSEITKVYGKGSLEVPVLHGINLTIEDGEFIAIMGPSGSGKSTLMNIIGFLDYPSTGTFELNGEQIGQEKEKRLAQLRNEHIGFVFQQFFLLPRQNVLKNVESPLVYAGTPRRERIRKSKTNDLKSWTRRPNESICQMNYLEDKKQRVAIARALVNNPSIILADEPTGALDSKTSKQIMDLFVQLHKEGRTVIIVTHEEEIAAYTNRVITLKDGVITDDQRRRP